MANRGRPRFPDLLTPREQEVLALIRDGLTNAQIAAHLNISPETAKYHVSEILSKLNVPTREAAAAWQPAARPFSLGRALIALACIGTLVATVGFLALLAWTLRPDKTDAELPTPPQGIGLLAFVSDSAGDFDIWAVNTDGNSLRLLVDLDEGASVSALRWSDDGATLTALVTYFVDNTPAYWEYTSDLAGQWSRSPATDAIRSMYEPEQVVVLPDYEFRDGPDGTPLRHAALTGVITASSPVNSERGAYVGFQEWNGPGSLSGNADTTSVWLLNEDGSNPRQLTREYGYTSATDWSYNGLWIALNCAPEFWQGEPTVSLPPGIEATMPMGICFTNRAGNSVTRITDGCNPTWTTDSRLIFVRGSSLRSIGTAGQDERIIVEYSGGYRLYALYQSGRATNLSRPGVTTC